MSKLNINKNEWLELVFEGKNKEYGAYKMRQEDGKTTMKAFFSAMALISGIAMLPIILSSFTDKPIITELPIDEPLVVTRLTLPNKVEIKKEIPALKSKVQKPITTKNLVNPTIVDATKAPDTDFTKPEDVGKTNVTNTGINGSPDGIITSTAVVPTAITEVIPDIMNTTSVEKNPAFPGGINEFLKIVGNRFVAPELEEEKILKVIVFFVVEKDGSLSNITVPRSPGFGLDLEAIRVLKSIKTKWEPGIYKGKPVRTSYSLPIVIKTQ